MIPSKFAVYLKPNAANGCLEWQRGRQGDGYGAININGKRTVVHREVWAALNGPIPAGMVIRHLCDNRICANPAHLALGSHADNKHDSVRQGRHRWNRYLGGDHPGARLTPENIIAIRADTRSQKRIAADYGISQPHVSDIKTGRKWSHL